MVDIDINTIKLDTKYIYISWNFIYYSTPPTVNYKTGKYEVPHNNINMSFNSLTHYPAIAKLDKIKLSSLDSELGIRSDHFKNIFKEKKQNKEFFLDLRDIANSIPDCNINITKDDKDNTPYFVIPINKFNNVYNVVIMYTNNDKIPIILGHTNHTSITLMSSIDITKKKN
jgi:hypothetical protein